MRLLSLRVMVPLTVLVVAWGAVHTLTSHTGSISPVTWPGGVTATPTPAAAVVPTADVAPTPSPPSGSGVMPLLPGALEQLNGSTRNTAAGLYAVIQQLEEALRSRLQALARQLEPGR
jgi:hypothetical protein